MNLAICTRFYVFSTSSIWRSEPACIMLPERTSSLHEYFLVESLVFFQAYILASRVYFVRVCCLFFKHLHFASLFQSILLSRGVDSLRSAKYMNVSSKCHYFWILHLTLPNERSHRVDSVKNNQNSQISILTKIWSVQISKSQPTSDRRSIFKRNLPRGSISVTNGTTQ